MIYELYLSESLLKNMSQLPSLLCTELMSLLESFLSPLHGPRASWDPARHPLSLPPAHSQAPCSTTLPAWLLFRHINTLLPQGLCTCYAHCLEYFCPRHQQPAYSVFPHAFVMDCLPALESKFHERSDFTVSLTAMGTPAPKTCA